MACVVDWKEGVTFQILHAGYLFGSLSCPVKTALLFHSRGHLISRISKYRASTVSILTMCRLPP